MYKWPKKMLLNLTIKKTTKNSILIQEPVT